MKGFEIMGNLSASYDVDMALKYGVEVAALYNKLEYLARYTTREDGYCWRTAEELEKEIGLSKKQQALAIKKLENAGLIYTKVTYIQGTQKRSKHFFVVGTSNPESYQTSLSEIPESNQTEITESYQTSLSESAESNFLYNNNQTVINKHNNIKEKNKKEKPIKHKYGEYNNVLHREKFLLPVMGILTWKVLIPAALLLGFIYILCQKKIFLSAALRIAILGIVLFSLIPAGIKVGDVMDASFGTDVMIERVKESISEIDEEAEEADNNNSEDTEKESSIWDKIVHKGEEIVDGVKSGGELLLQKAKVVLGNVMDVVAALIVTSCVIPIGILVILGAIIKALFGVIEKWIPIKKEKQ